MKADLSRQTFDPHKRYSGVLMQQGRVLLDSEWNEQQEIEQHRAESGTEGVIGPSGTPIGEDGTAPGFEVTDREGTLFVDEGHIYVDGTLCVNEGEARYDAGPDAGGQPYPPSPDELTGWMDGAGQDLKLGLVYLDVWERHVTHLDDERIREVALGGPDTTTRKQTVWQVKVREFDLKSDAKEDLDLLARYAELRDKSNPTGSESEELDKISPRAVEILDGLCERGERALDELRAPPTGKLTARTREPTGTSGPCQIPPGGGYERLENQLYRVEVHRKGDRGTARFKWSRDNGSLLTGIENVDVARKEITVKDTGRDEFLSFANGQWVEIVDDQTELQGSYRQLLQIDRSVDHARRIITVRQTPPAIDPDLHPKLRRWDQNGAANENGLRLVTQELEDGIEVEFGSGQYRAGDYWLIPARTATGDVEWPRVVPKDPASDPAALSPHGVRHSFCALAVVAAQGDSESARPSVLHDCRNLFPPLTMLTSLFYLGGAGQEAMPGKELPEPLRVGVANGQWPVRGARVRFEILDSKGTLRSEDDAITAESVTVLTDDGGVAACRWTLDSDIKKQNQRVRATLLGAGDDARHLSVHFSANLSVAAQVAYDPGNCANLKDTETTVQTALDRLSRLSSLYYLSGDGQHVPPDDVDNLDPLRVLVANDCGPVNKARVSFKVEPGNGTLESEEVATDTRGVASCRWRLDPETPVQRAIATLEEAAGHRTRGPTSFVFTATLNKSQARHVAYDPRDCEFLAETETVQEAIDRLCKRSGEEREPGFRVEEVRRISDDAPLRNNSEMPVHEFFEGLRIVFDQEVDPETANQATCFVTLGIPWPLTDDERRFFNVSRMVGFQPLVLRSTLKPAGNEIVWQPEVERPFVSNFSLLGHITPRVPARLTLKGNFIRALGEREVYLDGDAFADPDDELGLRRPTGDGRRGGDFELYVWLTTIEIG